jgi:hypothetical protein
MNYPVDPQAAVCAIWHSADYAVAGVGSNWASTLCFFALDMHTVSL